MAKSKDTNIHQVISDGLDNLKAGINRLKLNFFKEVKNETDEAMDRIEKASKKDKRYLEGVRVGMMHMILIFNKYFQESE